MKKIIAALVIMAALAAGRLYATDRPLSHPPPSPYPCFLGAVDRPVQNPYSPCFIGAAGES